MTVSEKHLKALERLHGDLEVFAKECLKVKNKAGETVPFLFNRPQRFLHKKLQAQIKRTGMVRALIGKGRQGGVSTYIGGRFYHRTSLNRGVETFILTHEQPATDNLFAMVERFYDHCPLRPSTGASNAKELSFDVLDSAYSLGTAGSVAVGRSKTVQLFHGSEVAFWKNAKDHFAGVVQTIPLEPGTEVVLESTGHGIGGEYHSRWQKAEAGEGDYEAIFIPWFWSEEYQRPLPPGFTLDEEEAEYARLHKLTMEQMVWRRSKLSELGDPLLFKQEYPATATEMFENTGHDGFISAEDVIRARKNTCEAIGPLVVGIDPSRFGDDRFSICWRRGRKVIKVESRSKIGTVEAVGWIKQIIDKDRPARVFMDVGGGGDRIFDILESYGSPYDKVIKLVNFGGAPQEPYEILRDGTKRAGPKNRRAEIWKRSKEWLEQEGGADIPDEDSLQTDACGPGYGYDLTTQQLTLESKEHMRDVRKLRSPDEWDSVALTFAEPVREPKEEKPQTSGVRTVQNGEQGQGWMGS